MCRDAIERRLVLRQQFYTSRAKYNITDGGVMGDYVRSDSKKYRKRTE
jgi:hypothetical protein